jgi:hypothetical protein
LFSHGSQYLTTLHVRYKACIPHCHLVLWFVGIYSLCCHSEYFTSSKMTLMVTAINLTTHVSHRTDLFHQLNQKNRWRTEEGMLQLHNVTNITKQMSGNFPPAHIWNQS